MAKLYYRHGVMDASKTANLLMVAHNYEKLSQAVIVLKPTIDIRSGISKIVSRLGIERDCISVGPDEDIKVIVDAHHAKSKLSCVLVDECQFLSYNQVMQLVSIVDELGIPVICYGLKNSYKPGVLFDGSMALIYYADSIEEIKNICSFCNRKATMNLRFCDGAAVYSGDIVKIGDTKKEYSEYYLPTCRKHYFNPPE